MPFLDDMATILAQMGGQEAFEKQLEGRFGWGAGTASKMFAMSNNYENTLQMMMRFCPNSSKKDLRFEVLPPIVEEIFKDWPALKQEYLVRAGVQIWFDERRTSKNAEERDMAWVGFHEHCTKWVHKAGYPSGKGDRELFGWTIEQGDRYADPDATVDWSDEEGSEAVGNEAKDKSDR